MLPAYAVISIPILVKLKQLDLDTRPYNRSLKFKSGAETTIRHRRIVMQNGAQWGGTGRNQIGTRIQNLVGRPLLNPAEERGWNLSFDFD